MLHHPVNHVTRTITHLKVNAAHIFTHDTQPEEHHSGQEELQNVAIQQRAHGLPERQRHQAIGHQPKIGEDRADRHSHPQQRKHLQRHQRKAGHQVKIQAQQLIERIFRFARRALGVRHHHLRRMDGEGIRQRRNEGAHFTRLVHQFDDPPRIRAQHATLIGHFDFGRALANAVEQFRRRTAPPGIPAPQVADGADVIKAFAVRGQQFVNLFGWILQISVKGHRHFATHMSEARHDGAVLAEVAREQRDAGFVRALLLLLKQQSRRAILAAVVDEDHLVGRAERIERRIEAREELGQHGLFVVDGDDDGQNRERHI